ncbi:MAG TPA: hypothetical protein VES73_08340 [Lamprocystis sp. (in: g-proteobacteria)]|nr:hypothetical protein [Lamprocystis sp. (in: g-proteobacteria)]
MESTQDIILDLARAPSLDYPPLRIVRFAAAALTEGVDEHLIDCVPVRITGIARRVGQERRRGSARPRRAPSLPTTF